MGFTENRVKIKPGRFFFVPGSSSLKQKKFWGLKKLQKQAILIVLPILIILIYLLYLYFFKNGLLVAHLRMFVAYFMLAKSLLRRITNCMKKICSKTWEKWTFLGLLLGIAVFAFAISCRQGNNSQNKANGAQGNSPSPASDANPLPPPPQKRLIRV